MPGLRSFLFLAFLLSAIAIALSPSPAAAFFDAYIDSLTVEDTARAAYNRVKVKKGTTGALQHAVFKLSYRGDATKGCRSRKPHCRAAPLWLSSEDKRYVSYDFLVAEVKVCSETVMREDSGSLPCSDCFLLPEIAECTGIGALNIDSIVRHIYSMFRQFVWCDFGFCFEVMWELETCVAVIGTRRSLLVELIC
jgi:hypothetical protein